VRKFAIIFRTDYGDLRRFDVSANGEDHARMVFSATAFLKGVHDLKEVKNPTSSADKIEFVIETVDDNLHQGYGDLDDTYKCQYTEDTGESR
jgi:hypothetical protein